MTFSCGNIVPIMESFPAWYGKGSQALTLGLRAVFPSQDLKTDHLNLAPKGAGYARITCKKAAQWSSRLPKGVNSSVLYVLQARRWL